MSEQADIEAALARATAAYKNVSAERDALKDANDRAEAAEAENDRLREALAKIAAEDFTITDDGTVRIPGPFAKIARAALAKAAGE
jgi:hypothetical protein